MNALFANQRPKNPISRRVLAALQSGHGQYAVWWGLLLPAVAAIVLVGLPMIVLPPSYLLPARPWAFALAAGQFSLIAWQEAIKQTVSLAAGLLTAVVAADLLKEGGGELLRLTSYSARQIRLALLGAVLRYLLVPLVIVLLARGLLVLLISQPTLLGANLVIPTALFRPDAFSVPFIIQRTVGRVSHAEYSLWELWIRQFESQSYLGLWPLWIAYYVLQPVWDALLFGLVGLVAASRVRSRDSAMLTASGLVIGLWASGYLGERLLAMLLTWLRDGYASLHWFIGAPAMDSGYLAYPSMSAMFLTVILGLKLLLLYLLLSRGQV